MKRENLAGYMTYIEDKFTKRIIFKEGESVAFMLNFAPQQALPAHKHPGTHVFLQVAEGSGTLVVDGESTAVKQQDVIVLEGQEEMSFVNDSQGNTSLYVVITKIPDERYAQNL